MKAKSLAMLFSGIFLDETPAALHPFPVNKTLASFLQDPTYFLAQDGVRSEDFEQKNIRAEHVYFALSNLAEGCANIGIKMPVYYSAAKNCIATTAILATDPDYSPYETSLNSTEELGDHGLYLSHLNIILGSWKRLTGDDTYQSLNQRVSMHLAEKTEQDSFKNIPSYPEIEYRWPADQTTALYSIWLYDQNYQASLGKKPAEDWLQSMKDFGKDKKTGLHISERTGTYPNAHEPRGCALSMSIRYMAAFAPEQAKEQWELYTKHFEQRYALFSGFREWSYGGPTLEDFDSGPLILENGVAATAFAIGASKAVGDERTYNRLNRTEKTTRAFVSLFGDENITVLANSLLASAIDFNMHTIE